MMICSNAEAPLRTGCMSFDGRRFGCLDSQGIIRQAAVAGARHVPTRHEGGIPHKKVGIMRNSHQSVHPCFSQAPSRPSPSLPPRARSQGPRAHGLEPASERLHHENAATFHLDLRGLHTLQASLMMSLDRRVREKRIARLQEQLLSPRR